MNDQRITKAEVAVWTGIASNILLAVMKGAVGTLANSKALVADAGRSASDAVRSIMLLNKQKSSGKGPAAAMLQPCGRAQTVSTLIVAMLLLLAGFELGIHSLRTLIQGVHQPPKTYALVAVLLSVAASELLFQYKAHSGYRLSQPALGANMLNRSLDLTASLILICGVGGALLGESLDAPALYYLDPLAGAIVGGLIMYGGCRLVADYNRCSKQEIYQEDVKEMLTIAQRIRGVITVDDLRAKEHGHYVVVDLKISVNPRISVTEGHDIAKHVKAILMARFTHISDVLIQVYPYDPGYPYKSTADFDHDDLPTMLH